MIFDRLPPLQTLRAFEATGRLSSMTLAAAELHVTHGAISRQIRMLEEHLGIKLFLRLTRQIILTEEGAEFHHAITRILGELTGESERLRGRNPAMSLRISTGVSFASKWLAPRLSRLKARYPEFDIHLDVTDINVDLNNGQVDAAIRYGNGRYRNASAERILEETVTPSVVRVISAHIAAWLTLRHFRAVSFSMRTGCWRTGKPGLPWPEKKISAAITVRPGVTAVWWQRPLSVAKAWRWGAVF